MTITSVVQARILFQHHLQISQNHIRITIHLPLDVHIPNLVFMPISVERSRKNRHTARHLTGDVLRKQLPISTKKARNRIISRSSCTVQFPIRILHMHVRIHGFLPLIVQSANQEDQVHLIWISQAC